MLLQQHDGDFCLSFGKCNFRIFVTLGDPELYFLVVLTKCQRHCKLIVDKIVRKGKEYGREKQ